MSHSVESLEAAFRSSEAKLNVILCQLEDCFVKYDLDQHKYAEVSQREAPMSLNPVKIISAMKSIATDFEEVKQEYHQLLNYKEKVSKELESETEGINKLINVTIDSLKT